MYLNVLLKMVRRVLEYARNEQLGCTFVPNYTNLKNFDLGTTQTVGL